jgi:hypothetical protein
MARRKIMLLSLFLFAVVSGIMAQNNARNILACMTALANTATTEFNMDYSKVEQDLKVYIYLDESERKNVRKGQSTKLNADWLTKSFGGSNENINEKEIVQQLRKENEKNKRFSLVTLKQFFNRYIPQKAFETVDNCISLNSISNNHLNGVKSIVSNDFGQTFSIRISNNQSLIDSPSLKINEIITTGCSPLNGKTLNNLEIQNRTEKIFVFERQWNKPVTVVFKCDNASDIEIHLEPVSLEPIPLSKYSRSYMLVVNGKYNHVIRLDFGTNGEVESGTHIVLDSSDPTNTLDKTKVYAKSLDGDLTRVKWETSNISTGYSSEAIFHFLDKDRNSFIVEEGQNYRKGKATSTFTGRGCDTTSKCTIDSIEKQ